MFDVIISGAGPSGSKCAEILAKNGFKTALIERDTNWRKPCGGGLSLRLFKYYPQLRKLNLPDKHSLVMYSADYHKLKYKYERSEEYSVVVDRLKFDNLIREVAVDAGAELFDKNISFDFITKNQQKIGIRTKSPSGIKEYLGKILIIADGMSSKLASKSGLRNRWKTKDLGIAKCAIMEGENSLDFNTVYFFYKPYYGYGWIFPIDEKRFNIGCITFYEDNFSYNINQVYMEFINESKVKKYLSGSDYRTIWLGAYPEPSLGVLENSLYGNNIMIIGDAAGFSSPISGEGIHASVVSGNIAAETAIRALEKEDYSEKTLKLYKSHQNIKKIIRNFRLKRSMADFFYENKGQNLNTILKLAENDTKFRKMVTDTFLFNVIPPKEFFSIVKNNIS
jgi:geranylgeranyl reductase family protein